MASTWHSEQLFFSSRLTVTVNTEDSPQGRQEEATWAPCADMCAGHVGRDPAMECAAVDAAATGEVTVRPCRVVRPQPSSGSTSAAAVYAPHPHLLRSCLP
ncbi:hypothetical protein QTP88_025615 [Uroleucon formosanum]